MGYRDRVPSFWVTTPQAMSNCEVHRSSLWKIIENLQSSWILQCRFYITFDQKPPTHSPVISPCVGRYGVVVDLPSIVTAVVASKNVYSVKPFVHGSAMPVLFVIIDHCSSAPCSNHLHGSKPNHSYLMSLIQSSYSDQRSCLWILRGKLAMVCHEPPFFVIRSTLFRALG